MINPSQNLWTPLAPLDLDWQGDTPVARDTGDIFFSTEDGLAESDYVFIEGNRLRERWRTEAHDRPFVIGEIGLGTGLNLCLTVAQWLAHRPSGARLHYVACERAPMKPADTQRALSHWPDLAPIISTLLAAGQTRCQVVTGGTFQSGVSPSTCGGPMQSTRCKTWPATADRG